MDKSQNSLVSQMWGLRNQNLSGDKINLLFPWVWGKDFNSNGTRIGESLSYKCF